MPKKMDMLPRDGRDFLEQFERLLVAGRLIPDE